MPQGVGRLCTYRQGPCTRVSGGGQHKLRSIPCTPAALVRPMAQHSRNPSATHDGDSEYDMGQWDPSTKLPGVRTLQSRTTRRIGSWLPRASETWPQYARSTSRWAEGAWQVAEVRRGTDRWPQPGGAGLDIWDDCVASHVRTGMRAPVYRKMRDGARHRVASAIHVPMLGISTLDAATATLANTDGTKDSAACRCRSLCRNKLWYEHAQVRDAWVARVT